MIDKQKIIAIYENLDIEYWTKGKNVTSGWVNIACPFCGDHSNHLGVNPTTSIYNCWRCGATGGFIDLLSELSGQSWSVCKSMVEESAVSFREPVIDKVLDLLSGGVVEEIESEETVVTSLPQEFELITLDIYSPLLDSYVVRRNLSWKTILSAGCGICRSGQYMSRMIIPVVCGGQLVAYQAADMTGFGSLKYENSPTYLGKVNEYLFGYDAIRKRMIVVEGILDKWRVGIEAVASFTSALTEAQRKLIFAKNLDELYLCYDGESKAIYRAREYAGEFMLSIPKVEVLQIPGGLDPNDAGREVIYELIADCN
ncbi:MAG: CHC2 zinc finger domain-containing protein [Candidatus Thorarchaeota archaeon]